MSQNKAGWLIGLAALGMMLGLLAGDISNLKTYSEALYPAFLAGVMTHISTVIAAFVGGNLVPNMFRDKTDSVSNATRSNLNEKAGV